MKRWWMLVAVCVVMTLTACASEKTVKEVEGLSEMGEISVITREKGSGTRTVFADLTGLREKSSGREYQDLIREDVDTAKSSDEVLRKVGETKGGIGYVSYGSLGDQLSEVKLLDLGGVKLSEENIASGKYDLSRSFYLAHSEKLKEAEQDFLNYVAGVGQDIVAEEFVPVGKSEIFLTERPKGTVKVHGSTSMAPLLKKLAEGYMEENPNAVVEVEASDSEQGVLDLLKGECDFAMVSRELEYYEKEVFNYERIAKDGIGIVVNRENPLENIHMEQLKAIYGGELSEWSELEKEKKQ